MKPSQKMLKASISLLAGGCCMWDGKMLESEYNEAWKKYLIGMGVLCSSRTAF